MRYLIFLLVLVFSYSSVAEEYHYHKDTRVQKLFHKLDSNADKCLTTKNKKECHNGIKHKYNGTGWCYRYVKLGLLEAGMTSGYIGGGSAVNAGPFLEKEGFINVIKKGDKPSDTPIGSILVFKVKTNKHGHIEVKTGNNTYISDYIRHYHPRNYELIGVYMKLSYVSNYQISNFVAEDYQL